MSIATYQGVLNARKRHQMLDYYNQPKIFKETGSFKQESRSMFNVFTTPEKGKSFKWRGAANYMMKIVEERIGQYLQTKEGNNYSNSNQNYFTPVTASAGNHAQGLALIMDWLSRQTLDNYGRIIPVKNNEQNLLSILNIRPALIHVPEETPQVKIDATKKLGGNAVRVIKQGKQFDDTKAFVENLCFSDVGNKLIHPFDNEYVIEGQGTVVLDILEQLVGESIESPSFKSELFNKFGQGQDLVFNVPCGGGGLVSGVSIVVRELLPEATINAIEPSYLPSVTNALIAGKPVLSVNNNEKENDGIGVATGIAVQLIGTKTLKVIKDNRVSARQVTGAQIKHSTYHFNDKNPAKKDLEQAGVVPITYCQAYAEEIKGKTIINILSGANIDPKEKEALKKVYGGKPFPQFNTQLVSYNPRVLYADELTIKEMTLDLRNFAKALSIAEILPAKQRVIETRRILDAYGRAHPGMKKLCEAHTGAYENSDINMMSKKIQKTVFVKHLNIENQKRYALDSSSFIHELLNSASDEMIGLRNILGITEKIAAIVNGKPTRLTKCKEEELQAIKPDDIIDDSLDLNPIIQENTKYFMLGLRDIKNLNQRIANTEKLQPLPKDNILREKQRFQNNLSFTHKFKKDAGSSFGEAACATR